MTDPNSRIMRSAKRLVDKVNFDMVGENGRGGNGGLISRETIRASDELRRDIHNAEELAKSSTDTPRQDIPVPGVYSKDQTKVAPNEPASHPPQPHVTSERYCIRDSYFGRYIAPVMPTGCDMIVVFADKHQHVPVWLGLPHQLYVRTAIDLMSEYECRTLTIVPYRNEDKVTISRAALATTEDRADG